LLNFAPAARYRVDDDAALYHVKDVAVPPCYTRSYQIGGSRKYRAMQKDQSPLPAERAEALLEGRRRLAHAFLSGATAVYKPHAALIEANERPSKAFRLHSGWALRERVLPEGRRAVLAIYLPGDVVGLDGLFSTRTAETVEALTPVACHALPLDGVARLMERDAAVALRVAHLFDAERRRAERLTIGLGHADAETRLASFLLYLHDRLRAQDLVSSRSFRVPMTQLQIGQHLGLTVVHVNRVLRRLREQGIALVRQNTAVIVDFDRLRALAMKTVAGASEPAGEGAHGRKPPAEAPSSAGEA
jgi:CRP-like cAMP-binding protein